MRRTANLDLMTMVVSRITGADPEALLSEGRDGVPYLDLHSRKARVAMLAGKLTRGRARAEQSREAEAEAAVRKTSGAGGAGAEV